MASDPKRLLWSSRLNALIIPFLLLSLTGCASTSLMGGVNQVGEKMYLTAVPEIPKDIEACMNMQDLSHEESKVNYLLYRIKNSGLPFIRNKARYSSDEAARFLRWKLNRPKWRPLVTSAREFVIIVTRGSSKTGQPYAIKFPDGTRRELKAILMNELDYLEEYLARAETSSLVAPETTRMEQPQDLKPTPESHIHRHFFGFDPLFRRECFHKPVIEGKRSMDVTLRRWFKVLWLFHACCLRGHKR